MVIRSARPEDIPAVLELWRQFWTPQPFESNLWNKIEKEPDMVLVAEDQGNIVGTVIGGFDLWWSWIYRVAVDQKSQRKGIGILLLKGIQERFKARGLNSAGLIVSPENKAMLFLLRKFTYREHKEGYYGIKFS